MSFIDSKTLQFYGQNYKKKKKTNYANQTEKKLTLPSTLCRSPAGLISPKSTKRVEPEPQGPRTVIPSCSKARGTEERDLQPPTSKTETPATADYLHGTIPNLALFNIDPGKEVPRLQKQHCQKIVILGRPRLAQVNSSFFHK